MRNPFLLLAILLTSNVFSQTYLNNSDALIIEYTIKFDFSGSTYLLSYPDYYNLEDVYASAQARYDYNHAMLSKEYYKLKDVTFINEEHKMFINDWRKTRLDWMYKAITTQNLGDSRVVKKITDYCLAIFEIDHVQAELKLLQAIDSELKRLKRELPGEYHKSERFKEILECIEKLKTCDTRKIGNLAWDYGLL